MFVEKFEGFPEEAYETNRGKAMQRDGRLDEVSFYRAVEELLGNYLTMGYVRDFKVTKCEGTEIDPDDHEMHAILVIEDDKNEFATVMDLGMYYVMYCAELVEDLDGMIERIVEDYEDGQYWFFTKK